MQTSPKDRPVKIPQTSYDLLTKVQKALPGKPTLVSLMEEGIDLLVRKYLPEDKTEE